MSKIPTRSLPLVTALGVAAVVGLSACGGESGGSAGGLPSTEAAATQAASQSSNDPGGITPVTPTPAPEVTDAVASRTTSYDGDRVRIDVLSLRRSGELSVLQLRETYLGTESYNINNDLGSGAADYDLSGITLVDGENGKRYLTAHDSDDDCVCSRTIGVTIKPGSSYTLSATFAAPPSDVRTVDLAIPGLGTINDVPVG
jgi:hypothetical protein